MRGMFNTDFSGVIGESEQLLPVENFPAIAGPCEETDAREDRAETKGCEDVKRLLPPIQTCRIAK